MHRRNVTLLTIVVVSGGIFASVLPALISNPDSSSFKRSDAPIVNSVSSGGTAAPSMKAPSAVGGVMSSAPKAKSQAHGKGIVVRYKAKQVIAPGEGSEQIGIGTSFIGKLLIGIDTRSLQNVQVTLPYGGSDKNGNGSLPPGTVLYGQPSYPGHDDKVYINFDHGVLPDGQEIKIQARALSSKDYSPGLIGDFHSNTGTQMASAMSLSMMSGMSEVMVEKEGLGNTYTATPKSTLRNGFYNGLSKVTEAEANREIDKVSQIPDYVTIAEGSDVIISLTSSYRSGSGQ